MASIIITEQQLVKLMETAMDLDIYVQPIDPMVPSTNDDFTGAMESIKSKIDELIMMTQNGKNIEQQNKIEIYKLLDLINKVYEKIKYVDKKDVVPMF